MAHQSAELFKGSATVAELVLDQSWQLAKRLMIFRDQEQRVVAKPMRTFE
jgi:hypothetical protein